MRLTTMRLTTLRHHKRSRRPDAAGRPLPPSTATPPRRFESRTDEFAYHLRRSLGHLD